MNQMRMNEWHEVNNEWLRLLGDWLMENGGPRGSWMYAASLRFGVTEKWIATLWHSDAFQDYYQRRLR
jgi:hypothetical protein